MQQDGHSGDGPYETPESKGPSLNDLAKQWISRFESCARSRKYDNLTKLFHEKVVWCGLESNICATLTQAIERECKEVWPGQLAFSIDLARAVILSDAQSVVMIAPWVSRGLIAGSAAKEGRVTFVLGIFENGKLLGLHAHFSLNPAVSIKKG